MEELEEQNISPIPEPHPLIPPGDKHPPLDADEARLAQCDQMRGADATYCSAPQGSSASSPSGSDGGLPTAATLESVADDINAGDRDAFSGQVSAAVDFEDGGCTGSNLGEQVTGGEAEVLAPQCSAGTPPSCSSGGVEKFIASESNAAYMVSDDADDKHKASRVGAEGGENISTGMNAEILLPQGSPAVSPSGSVGGIQKFASFETDTTSAIVGDDAIAAEEAVSQMDTVGGKQMNDDMQEEALIPQSSSAVFHSGADSDLLKVDDNETGTFAKIASDFGTVEETILKTDVGSVPISKWQQEEDCLQDEVLLSQGSHDSFLSGSDGGLLKFAASEIDTVNNNTSDAYAVEDAGLKMDVDSVPISQWQGPDGTQEVVLIPQNSYALSSGSDSDLLKIPVFQTSTTLAAASKMDVDSAPILLCKQVECGESFVPIPKRPSTALSFISDGAFEKVAASDPDTVAIPGYDVSVKEDVTIVDGGSSDNVQPYLCEQMKIVGKADILIANDSSCKFNPEFGAEVFNIAATEPDTATMSHEIADAMDDIPAQMDADADDAPVVARRGGGRKKRGRPAKVQVSRISARRKEEEDVCFICFDGGDLVVCDRRGCPKVYHPSCVNRDEAFFRAKGRWSCGWHICSSCESSARHMCFTCTHSLCRGCIKEAGFFCVRGNKGFCEACMSTVMLIESNMQGNDQMIGVDFDDKSSFEYLFKDYYLALKAKLSLTLEELMRAKDSIKRSDVAAGNEESSDDMHLAKEEQGASSDSSSDHKEERTSKKKLRKKSENTVNETGSVKETENVELSNTRDFDWASDELLEFVEHMKNGDRSPLSQFDVQSLLLEYIKRNNLRDPRRKSQIVCDSRLQNLFGKPRVGHFEMLKLLESHFFTKEVTTLEAEDKQGGVVDPDPDLSDAKGNNNSFLKLTLDKKRKTRKKVDEKELPTNLDDYAAIDVHNISLMYLRRNLMEDLVDEADFDAKVIGSFVRIRISGVGQRQDMYRLVQIVGTGKAAERYKTGKKTTDVTLEILNLNKKETITVDIISNQEFTEEECKRLRQSIKCGFIGPLTVGDVQEKARSLQVAKVNDWLESEKLRLGHLRDRASETGRRKELRECIEKLQLLNTPEERYRRLNEVPEIHTDPHMDPDYESAEEEETDIRKQEYYGKSRGSSILGNGREVKSPRTGVSVVSEKWSSSRKNSNNWESNRSTLIEGSSVADLSSNRVDSTEFSLNQANDIHKTSASETPKNHEHVNASDVSLYNEKNHVTAKQSSDDPQGTQKSPLPGGLAAVANPSDSDKIWHYKDPSGKVQGPFSMTQLRKWNTTGYFPPNLRIWRTSEKPEDSILLADALIGKFEKDLPEWEPPSKSTSQPMVGSPTVFAAETSSGLWRESNDSTLSNSKHSTQKWNVCQNENWASRPSSWSSSGMDTGVSPKDANVKFGQAQGQNKPFVSQPSSQYYDNPPYWSTTSKLSSNTSKVVLVSESLSQRRNDSPNALTPTSQPNNVSWSAAEDFADKHMPSAASAQDITASLVNRGREEEESSFAAKEPLRSITNSFRESSVGSAQHVREQTSMSDGGKFLPAADLSAYGTVSIGQTIASTHEQSTSEILSSEYNQLTPSKLSDTHNRLLLQQEQNDSDKQLLRMHDLPSDGSRSNAENAGGKTVFTEVENLGPAVNSKIIQADSACMVGSLDKQIYQSSAVSYPASHFKTQNILPESPAVGTHPSEEMATKLFVQAGAIESSSTHRSAAPKPEPVHSANYEIPTQTNTSTNLTPSALHMTPYGRNSATDSATVSKENMQLLSPDGSNPLPTSQFGTNIAILPVQPSQLGFGTGSNTQTTTSSVVTHNSTQNPGPAQGSGNMIWTPVPQGNMNAGWGMVAPGGMNMPWGQPPQTISDVNMTMGAQSQVNTMMNTGWVAPAQGNTNMNVGWVASPMGSTSQTPGWAGPLPGNFPVNPVWAMLLQGQANPGPGWVAPVLQNPNQNWETPAQGNMNMNTPWVPGQGNTNPPGNPSAGNPQNLSQPPQHGDWRSGQGDNSRVNDSWHSNRRPPPNWAQSGGGLSGPQRGQMGKCKFHEMGYCKKGAACNYIHQ